MVNRVDSASARAVSAGARSRHVVGVDRVAVALRALVVVLLAGAVCLCSAPFVLQAWHGVQVSRAVDAAQAAAASEDSRVRSAALSAARKYNEQLGDGVMFGGEPSVGYLSQLGGGSVMATLEIPAVGIKVLVGYGAGEDSLAMGAGHLYGSSLPVGGLGSNAVIAGHDGDPVNKFFTALPDVVEGDLFRVSVEGEDLWYRVDRTAVDVPANLGKYFVREPGVDRVTLFTCYPYGQNTHRFIVSGVRTDAPLSAVSRRWSSDPALPWAAGVVVVALVVGMVAWSPLRRRRGKHCGVAK